MKQKKVLIVEDNALNMKLVRDVLKIDGIESVEAERAEDGLELARTSRPDLILMDIDLPGMDGFTAMRIIKDDPALSGIPVLALTAYAMEGDKNQAKEAGCMGYITKPLKISSFRDTVKKYLGAPDQSSVKKNKRHECLPVIKVSNGKRILIVDDEALNIKLLDAQLSSKGYQTLSADNGRDAVEIVRNGKPDLILLDIMMPGMDGYEVTSLLKSDPSISEIPVILVTALTGEDNKQKGLEAGADEFINKPINYPELEARIISLLKLKEYREQLGSRKQSEELMIERAMDRRVSAESRAGLPTVLIVDDNRSTVELIRLFLSGMRCNIEIAETGENAMDIINNKKIDVMLLDLMLPGMDGFEVCRRIKNNEKSFPVQIVMFTSLTDTASKLKGIEAGTDDFLIKPVDRDELKARVMALFKKKAYLDQLLLKADNALQAAITDRLTGIYNYGYFKHYLNMEFERAGKNEHKLALLMIDVDNFKAFNDRYGHPNGDRALKKIAEILSDNIREIDFIARYGGEEFALVLPYVNRGTALIIAERLLCKVEEQFEIPDIPDSRLSVSIGVSLFPDQADSPDELIRTADAALYRSKNNGKNCMSFYSECSKSVNSREEGKVI